MSKKTDDLRTQLDNETRRRVVAEEKARYATATLERIAAEPAPTAPAAPPPVAPPAPPSPPRTHREVYREIRERAPYLAAQYLLNHQLELDQPAEVA